MSGVIEFRHYNYGSQHAAAGVGAIRHGTVEVKESHLKQLAELFYFQFIIMFLQLTFLFTNVVEWPTPAAAATLKNILVLKSKYPEGNLYKMNIQLLYFAFNLKKK